MKIISLFFFLLCTTLSFTQKKASDWNVLAEQELRKDSEKSLDYALKALKKAKASKNGFELGRSYLNIANAHNQDFHLDKATNNIDKAIIHFRKLKNDTMLAESYITRGYIRLDKTEFFKSADDFFKAEKHFQKAQDKPGLSRVYNALGIVYDESKNSDKAVYYYKKSLRYSRELRDTKMEGITLLNIGVVVMNDSLFNEAQKYYDQALEIFDSLNFKGGRLTTLNNIAINNRRLKRYDVSLQMYETLLDEYEQSKDSVTIARTLTNIAAVYRDKRDFASAEIVLLKSAKISETIGDQSNQRLTYGKLHLNYRDLNDFQNAYKFSILEAKTQKKIYSKEKNDQLLDLNEKYQSKEKQNQILKLSNANNLEKAKTANLRLWNYGIVGGTCFLLLSIIFLWNRRRLKHKQKTLEVSIQASEQEKVRIGKELHDGIANELITFFYKIEDTQPEIAHQVLTSYQKVRKVSHQLDNTAPHGTPISERLIDLIPDNDIETIINISPQYLELDEPIGTHIYRIAQELLINTKKYAKANTIDLQITVHNQTLFFSFKDDGIGTGNFTPGNGHKNISDRVQLMSGTINIKTDNEHGFNVKIEIPLK